MRDTTLFEAIGGAAGVLQLAHAWHQRVMADEIVAHAFSHGFHPRHTERLAAYWGEAWGGPTTYSQRYGSQSSVTARTRRWTVAPLSASTAHWTMWDSSTPYFAACSTHTSLGPRQARWHRTPRARTKCQVTYPFLAGLGKACNGERGDRSLAAGPR